MRWIFCLIALLLTLPAKAAETLTLQADCYDADRVRDAIKGSSIVPMGVGVNSDQEMVILFSVRGGGYWIALAKADGKTVCDLSAGPQWEMMKSTVPVPGQES